MTRSNAFQMEEAGELIWESFYRGQISFPDTTGTEVPLGQAQKDYDTLKSLWPSFLRSAPRGFMRKIKLYLLNKEKWNVHR